MLNPTHADAAYGPHERHRLDVWLAKSKSPTPFLFHVHGGGFRGGDKRDIPDAMLDTLLDGGVSVVSCNYRFADDPEYRAPVLDAARALQTARHRASEWNLDKSRVAVGGCSAGAVTAFWLAFGPERAEPKSKDPIARESTLARCVASWEAQTTIDPLYLRKLIAGPTWTIQSVQTFFRLTPDQYDTPHARKLFKEFHFIDHVIRRSPPVFLYNVTPNLPMTDDLAIGPGIHHPILGTALKEVMDRAGVECIHRTREQVIDLTDEQAGEQYNRELAAFVVRHLQSGRDVR